jgi:hypothetical protein
MIEVVVFEEAVKRLCSLKKTAVTGAILLRANLNMLHFAGKIPKVSAIFYKVNLQCI